MWEICIGEQTTVYIIMLKNTRARVMNDWMNNVAQNGNSAWLSELFRARALCINGCMEIQYKAKLQK